MARSRKNNQGEREDGQSLTGNGEGNGSTSSNHNLKVGEEADRLEKTNTYRSKHSETEQRRRSKINERFQVLRDLLPHHDQKRDKASLLMEVIEYIQFLQAKLQIYEGSHQEWKQEPTKLIPWRCNRGTTENTADLSQISQNGSSLENHGYPELFESAHNPLESTLFTAAVEKVESPLSASEAVLLNTHMQSNIFDVLMRSSLPADYLQEPLSNISCMPSLSQLLLNRSNVNDYAPSNGTSKDDTFPILVPTESGAGSMSSAYSQVVLDTLAQALQSSGVDLSDTTISVQLEVEQRAKTGSNTSRSKMHVNQSFGGQTIPWIELHNAGEDSEPAVKRLRT